MASPAKSKSRSRSLSTGSKKSRSRSASSSLSRSSRSRSRSSERDGYRLHIADIGDEVRKSDLEKIFAPFGELREVWLTNSRPCFGFAVFKDKKDAATAVKACDGMEICGCRIKVSYARPRTRGQGRRSYSSNMRCYQCGYSGHFYRDCPDISGGNDGRKDRYGRDRRRYRGGGDRGGDRGDRGDRGGERGDRGDRGGGQGGEKDYGGGGGGGGSGGRRRSSYRSRRSSTDEFGRRRRSEGTSRRHR